LIAACGKDVKVSTKELESNSRLSDGNSTVTNQEGTLKRGTPDVISINGSDLKVSTYSSYQVLEFVAIRPLNSQTLVKYRGKTLNNELVLEYLEAK
jgi:hypothetical protein